MPIQTYNTEEFTDIRLDMFISFWKKSLSKICEDIALRLCIAEEEKELIALKIEKELGFNVSCVFAAVKTEKEEDKIKYKVVFIFNFNSKNDDDIYFFISCAFDIEKPLISRSFCFGKQLTVSAKLKDGYTVFLLDENGKLRKS